MSIRAKKPARKSPVRPRSTRPHTPRRGLPWGTGADRSRVGVRELRQYLSVYLDRVKTGESLTVTEHGQVVAVLMPASKAMTPVERLIAEGRAAPATRSLRDLPPPRSAQPGAESSEGITSARRSERLP
jgi:prevent-host-death family protein